LPVKRYVNYTAVGTGGHIAVDTAGGIEFDAPGAQGASDVVDVDSDAFYPIFVEAVATNHSSGFAGCPPSEPESTA
jgi:hypothetical protein